MDRCCSSENSRTCKLILSSTETKRWQPHPVKAAAFPRFSPLSTQTTASAGKEKLLAPLVIRTFTRGNSHPYKKAVLASIGKTRLNRDLFANTTYLSKRQMHLHRDYSHVSPIHYASNLQWKFHFPYS